MNGNSSGIALRVGGFHVTRGCPEEGGGSEGCSFVCLVMKEPVFPSLITHFKCNRKPHTTAFLTTNRLKLVKSEWAELSELPAKWDSVHSISGRV